MIPVVYVFEFPLMNIYFSFLQSINLNLTHSYPAIQFKDGSHLMVYQMMQIYFSIIYIYALFFMLKLYEALHQLLTSLFQLFKCLYHLGVKTCPWLENADWAKANIYMPVFVCVHCLWGVCVCIAFEFLINIF